MLGPRARRFPQLRAAHQQPWPPWAAAARWEAQGRLWRAPDSPGARARPRCRPQPRGACFRAARRYVGAFPGRRGKTAAGVGIQGRRACWSSLAGLLRWDTRAPAPAAVAAVVCLRVCASDLLELSKTEEITVCAREGRDDATPKQLRSIPRKCEPTLFGGACAPKLAAFCAVLLLRVLTMDLSRSTVLEKYDSGAFRPHFPNSAL